LFGKLLHHYSFSGLSAKGTDLELAVLHSTGY